MGHDKETLQPPRSPQAPKSRQSIEVKLLLLITHHAPPGISGPRQRSRKDHQHHIASKLPKVTCHYPALKPPGTQARSPAARSGASQEAESGLALPLHIAVVEEGGRGGVSASMLGKQPSGTPGTGRRMQGQEVKTKADARMPPTENTLLLLLLFLLLQ